MRICPVLSSPDSRWNDTSRMDCHADSSESCSKLVPSLGAAKELKEVNALPPISKWVSRARETLSIAPGNKASALDCFFNQRWFYRMERKSVVILEFKCFGMTFSTSHLEEVWRPSCAESEVLQRVFKIKDIIDSSADESIGEGKICFTLDGCVLGPLLFVV